jgi:hypothetical protein
MYKDSIYKKMYEQGEKVLHTGYDYEKRGLVKRFVASRMLMNTVMDEFLTRMDPLFKEFLNSVKKIQFYQNYTIDKNDSTLNN